MIVSPIPYRSGDLKCALGGGFNSKPTVVCSGSVFRTSSHNASPEIPERKDLAVISLSVGELVSQPSRLRPTSNEGRRLTSKTSCVEDDSGIEADLGDSELEPPFVQRVMVGRTWDGVSEPEGSVFVVSAVRSPVTGTIVDECVFSSDVTRNPRSARAIFPPSRFLAISPKLHSGSPFFLDREHSLDSVCEEVAFRDQSPPRPEVVAREPGKVD
jgi:hypothetical protein